ncbi:glucuronide permease [Salipaludibacillus neizhouensis]|uniref:Glucuronide permease n=1 Tax=Salipaludibacillus neizhouensis TaxID=885475 RepID=A0A3A9JX86_9BACI|nr:MFS transporter [Salipaludibacillus neizhouensis]RKL65504.1 glucuronide permease [Salipaludibacillus neizhouensis]
MSMKEERKIKREQRKMAEMERNKKFRRATWWQLALYPMYSMGHNAFSFMMAIVSYYAAGPVGLGTVIASFIITGTRIFDGITDPIVGLIVDKTKGKFGKVRPTALIGYLTMATSTSVMFFTTHLVPEGFRMIYFILLYIVFIIGYTINGVAGNIGNNVLTNDPRQRPIFGGLGMIYTMLFYTAGTIYLSVFLTRKYTYSDVELFHEMLIFTLIVGAIAMVAQIIGIWSKDRLENFGIGKNTVKIKSKDLWPILKRNRPLQAFSVAMVTDKLGMQIAGNSIVAVMLFGIIIGDYSTLGLTQGVSMIPNIIVLILGISFAMRIGSKRAYVFATWAALITYVLMFFLLWLGDPTQIRIDNMNFMTVSFFILFIAKNCFRYVSSGLVSPMLTDVIDYNTYQTNTYGAGVISALYGLIDKVVSSLQQTFVGLLLAFIGFKSAFPDIDTPYSDKIFWMTMLLSIGVMVVAYIASLIAMKFYDLDKDRMEEIQEELERRRQADIIDDEPTALTK